ncbi:UNVERIFIED_CONTAM: hypothetical protein GTU68_010384 [Idotea baltica]|nr:hypothetical protein [Idotea baltica]
MARKFDVPDYYRSEAVLSLKQSRHKLDPKKHDLRPTIVDFGPVQFQLARHFGFCFGVENAIEIAYKVVNENSGKRIFLLSEMIHNPSVNADLLSKGVRFLMKTDGTRLIDFETLNAEDIVVVPAFGTTIELQKELEAAGVNPYKYDATCPFVEKVWKRADDLGRRGFTVIVHGKHTHEETRATFSHSKTTAPTLIVRDMEQAQSVISYMRGEKSSEAILKEFATAVSEDFNPERDLIKIGVVNQTTMLATDTKAIAAEFRSAMESKYGPEALKEHFADTRDTLCYATYENQSATRELTQSGAHLSLVVGGYNSSNTSHLVELLQEHMPSFYIKDSDEILSRTKISHFDLGQKKILETSNWLPNSDVSPVKIAITAGASCPDSSVDEVIRKVAEFFPGARNWDKAIADSSTLND